MDATTTAPSTRSTLARQPLELEPPVPDTLLLQEQLNAWEESYHSEGFDAVALLGRIADILERAMEDFLHLNPDPLDDRHPLRTHPTASFGIMLKAIIRKEIFMQTLIVSYLMARDNVPLAEAAARVLLSCVPALDSDSIFSDPEELIPCLYKYAANGGSDGLKAYSFGLLASAMEVQDNAGKYRKENGELIPIALRELQRMRDEMERAASREHEDSNSNGEMAGGSRAESPVATFPAAPQENGTIAIENLVPENSLRVRKRTMNGGEEKPAERGGGGAESPPRKKRKSALRPLSPPNSADESSVSQWNVIKHVLIGTHKIYPLTIKMHQRLIIQYLGSIGEYQDMLVLAYEGNSMSLLFDYISMDFTDDVRLTFDALKYLCSLLVHRKFALEFVSKEGVQKLLKVPCTSLAGVGVATCFYYLSYGVDVMERVCQLEEKVIDQVVEYMLWVQEHSHESGMASATMFFTHALAFRAILDRFDARDGLRKLYNYMSTLTLLQHAATDSDLTEEQMQTSTQTIRNTCGALKTYATSHLFMRVEQYRRMNMAREGAREKAMGDAPRSQPTVTPRHGAIATTSQPPANIPYYKPMHMEEETLRQAVWMLAGLQKAHYSGWKAMESLRSIGLLRLLLTMVLKAHAWVTVSAGKIEIAVNTMTTIMVAATIPRVQADLCAPVSADVPVTGLSVIFTLCDEERADGDDASVPPHKLYGDAEAPIAALCAFVACLAPPIEQEGGRKLSVARKLHGGSGGGGGGAHSSGSKHGLQPAAELFKKMVETIRSSNGLMALNKLIRSKTPITAADEIRFLTCKVLVALARDPEVRRILLLLPLISQNELHDVMNEPACPDKKAMHAQFCAEAKVLIATVTEKSLKDVKKDLTQERLWKSHIISSTQIAYNERELLQLIHDHLVSKGLSTAAAALSTEADLAGQLPLAAAAAAAAGSNGLAANGTTGGGAAAATTSSAAKALEGLPSLNILTRPRSPSRRMASLPTAGLRYAPTPGGRPRKTRDGGSTPFPRRLPIRPSGPRVRGVNERVIVKPPSMELTDIVTEYFRVQHSNCANPVSTCPPFSLFHPHRCPEPAPWRRVPQNVTARCLESGIYSHRSRMSKQALDERFIFSRFRPSKTFNEAEEHYTACSFSIDDEHLIVGTFSGEVQWMNIETGLCEATAQCHHSAISDIIPSKDGSMLLTSGMFMQPQSTLWRLGDQQTHYMDFPDDTAVRFNNGPVQNMIVGTSIGKATVYDVETSCTRRKLQNVDKNGQFYNYSKAMFSPCDEMILYDNTLYDIRAADPVVRSFDRMNQNNGGCFHPHGNEIIINTEVWDMRSFRLLHSVPALDQCRLQFNATGNIILAGQYSPLNDPYKTQFASTLRTMSSSDYSVISTLDTRKALLDFCFSHADTDLAVVEVVKSFSQSEYSVRTDETACRTYEIGKVRVAEDGDEDGEQDEPDMDGDGGDSSDSSEDEDSEDSGSDDSEGALDMLGRMAGGSEGEDDENDEEESSEEEDEDGDGSSSGWETASNQEDGGAGEEVNDGEESGEDEDEDNEDEDEAEGSDISIFMDDGSDEEDDQDDPAFNPDVDERGGTSNIILNPNLRRRRGM